MAVQICSCEGLNPKCEKCFGSGYSNAPEKITNNKKSPKKNSANQNAFITEDTNPLERKEIQNKADKIIATLDLKSMQQMRILHSIPFSTTTFRRDFKDKFVSFDIMENEKRALRAELNSLLKEANKNGISIRVKHNHLLSDKDIDVTSNRELKTLIREYKKQNTKKK